MDNVLDHKCPKCEAVLKFNPKEQNFKCEYCRSIFSLNDLNTMPLLKQMNNIGLDVYKCNNCGREILCDINTSQTSCVYCKNTTILKNRLQGEFNPEYLIPFRTNKEDAIKVFKRFCKGKWLMPKEFNVKRNIKDIFGIYVPFLIYDFDAMGEIKTECDKITNWASNGYKYTKTDRYNVIRGGHMHFENIPVDVSKKFENDIINSIEPFDYNDIKQFNYSYLSGFLSERYDLSSDESIKDASIRAKNIFIEEMKKDIKGYDKITEIENSVNLNKINSSYILLPIWFLNIKYKDKIHTFAMNGQTGKIVGNIPVDVKKTIFIWISLFIVIFILLLLLNIFQVML